MKRIFTFQVTLSFLFFFLLASINIFAAGYSQDLCIQLENQSVHVGTLITNFDASGNIVVKLVVDKNLNDNTYGTNAIGWPKDHKFKDLVGSDKARFVFKNKSGDIILDFDLDYISGDKNSSSGYACLGVDGGDGKMHTGNSAYVINYNSSLSRNFNEFGYVLTTNSPATDENYTVNPSYPDWIYEMIYEVTIDKAAFGTDGFGSVSVPELHNSPHKIGDKNAVEPEFCSGSIGDLIWEDLNKNGIQDYGEPGMPNLTVKLYDCSTNALVSTTQSDANGYYLFTPLSHGEYYVQFEIPAGYAVSPQAQGNNPELDSNPDVTGATTCITLAVGEVNTSIDAGMYKVPPPKGSIGDFVWNDINQNGIQDNGEPGIEGVDVRLLDCSNNIVLATVVTDQNGGYLFDDLDAGDYFVEFKLKSGFTFSPSLQGDDRAADSNPDPTTGKTACITLAAGENNLTLDAGMFVPQNKYPRVWIKKDDGIIIAPDCGNTTTYSIMFGNSGDAALYNTVITDTLPYGMKYVSSSSGQEESNGNNIVKFNIGTLNPNDQATVTLTASVSELKDCYFNTVCITGNDINNTTYMDCDEDLDIKDTCSDVNDGGIESKGDLAQLLLQRELKIKYGMTTPIRLKEGNAAITSKHELAEFMPETGPFDSRPVESTPFDILGISNAVSSYAVNYSIKLNQAEARVGGIFSTITEAPKIYDHFKTVCDRLAGYSVEEIKLVNINGYQFYAAKLTMQSDNTTDYAISFSVYESADGYYVQNKWTYDEYQAPQGASSVYNFQIWSDSYKGTISLAKKVLAKFSAISQTKYMNISQLNPDVFISKAYYSHDGKIHLLVVNNGNEKDVNFTTKYRISQESDQLTFKDSHHLTAGLNKLIIEPGIISDANVYLTDPAGFKDEVYVSGGSFAYITGPSSSFANFNTSEFTQTAAPNYPEGSLILAGGVEASGNLGDWVSIVRSLNAGSRPYDLSGFDALKFEAKGNCTVQVIINTADIKNYNYFAYKINLAAEKQEYTINFNRLKQLYGDEVKFDPAKVEFIGFMITTDANQGLSGFDINVQNIAFTGESVTGVNNSNPVPQRFELAQNYPNPFNPTTVIRFSVPESGHYSLKVFNLLGQEVSTLLNGELHPGNYNVSFDAGNLASGMYIYSLISEKQQIIKKMVLMK